MKRVLLALACAASPLWADASAPEPAQDAAAAAGELWTAIVRGDSARVAALSGDHVVFDAGDPILDGPSGKAAAAARFELMPRARFVKLVSGGIHNFMLRGGTPWWRSDLAGGGEAERKAVSRLVPGARLWVTADVACQDVGPGGTRASGRFSLSVLFQRSQGKLRAVGLLSRYSGLNYYK